MGGPNTPRAREVVGSNPTDPTKRRTHPLSSLGELLSFGLWMRKEGYRESTITYAIQALRSIARRADILDPESAKVYLASAPLSESRKEKLSEDLARFYRYRREPFDKPRYRGIEKLPFIPMECEIDQLISGTGRKLTVFLQLLKETGMRAGEAWNLKWTDLDALNRTVSVSPEKNSRPRQLPISSRPVGWMPVVLADRYILISHLHDALVTFKCPNPELPNLGVRD